MGQYNRWTIIGPICHDKYSHRQCLCRCDCGTERMVIACDLPSGRSKSCGCLRDERMMASVTTHGLSDTPEHYIWRAMKRRCSNKNDRNFRNYGGRGISVLEPWASSFEAFYADMGKKPFEKAQIDRIDNNGPYCKENCRWTSCKLNCQNRRNNIFVEFNGERMCLSECAIKAGVKYNSLYYRITALGLPLEQALKPIRTTRCHSKAKVC